MVVFVAITMGLIQPLLHGTGLTTPLKQDAHSDENPCEQYSPQFSVDKKRYAYVSFGN